jgi:hypothetical protein
MGSLTSRNLNARRVLDVQGAGYPRRQPMQKCAIFATLVVAFATPALAAQYYVGQDVSTNKCQVVDQEPDGTTMKMVGSGAYKSEAEAESAIPSLTDCNK